MLHGTYGEPQLLLHAWQTVGKYMHHAALVLCGISSKLPPLSPAQQTVHGFMDCAALMMCTTNGKPQLLSSAQQTVGKYMNHVALVPSKIGSELPSFLSAIKANSGQVHGSCCALTHEQNQWWIKKQWKH